MKIVSDFQDYYDGTALGLDPGPTPLYRRKTRVTHAFGSSHVRPWQVNAYERNTAQGAPPDALLFRSWPTELRSLEELWFAAPRSPHVMDRANGFRQSDWAYTSRLLVFCGKAYLFYGRTYPSPTDYIAALRPNGKLPGELATLLGSTPLAGHPALQEGEAAAKARRVQAAISRWLEGGFVGDDANRWWTREHGERPVLTERSVERWEAFDKSVPDDVHRYVGAPVFTVGGGRHGALEITADPELKPLGFSSVVDAYTAFQELDRMLSNVLVDQVAPPLTTGGDEIVRDAKGFDGMSFKNGPGQGKKARREARRRGN